VGLTLVATGCGKKETVASTAPAPAAANATAAIAEVTLPDLEATSVTQLASASSETLTNLAALAGPSQPEVVKQAEAVKSAISANRAVDALGQIKQLAASAQAIPGAPAVIEATKQMVSAWALKQGFDTAMIAPVLGALQAGDYAGLGSQAAMLFGAGGLTDQQKELLNGVLSTYGISSKADELMGKVKGLR